MFKSPCKEILIPLTGLIAVSCNSDQMVGNRSTERPNIIFIMSDDHTWQAVSCYEHQVSEFATTPSIDRLASQGMRFDRCLVTNSICGPSRATILTGKYSHQNGVFGNAAKTSKFDNTQQTFPDLLQKSGYSTALIGKWHLHGKPSGFDHYDILPGQGAYYNPSFILNDSLYQEKGYVTDIITKKSIEWIAEASKTDNPFMIMVHHKAPHRKWEPAPEYLNLYRDVKFNEPATLLDENSGRGRAAKESDMSIAETMKMDSDLKIWEDSTSEGYRKFIERLDNEQRSAWEEAYRPLINEFMELNLDNNDRIRWKYQRYMQDYMACIKSVDDGVGEIMSFLEETGLDRNTIVIYTSDQGFFLGEHGWFDKRFIYEESLRSPLIIKYPGVISPGSYCNELVSNLDFAGTMLDAAGVAIPDDIQGKSMLPLFEKGYSTDWRKEHYYHYYEFPGSHRVKRHYGIVTERYKLVHFYFDIDEWELYDLKNDPDELTNVYEDDEYREVREELHERLLELMDFYGDSNELRESIIPDRNVTEK